MKSKKDLKNQDDMQIREDNLNKFLCNCLGVFRRPKPIEAMVMNNQPKRFTEPIASPAL